MIEFEKRPKLLEALYGLPSGTLKEKSPTVTLFGCPVLIVDEKYLPIVGYIQNKRHKKHRINKKWRKRYGTTPIRDVNFCAVFKDPFGNNTFLMSQKRFDDMTKTVRGFNFDQT